MPRLTLRVLTDISACRLQKRSDGTTYPEPMHALVAVEDDSHNSKREDRRRFEGDIFSIAFPFGFRLG